MTRTLSLDVGDRRIGVALSDPEGILASPYIIIERKSDKEDIEAILRITEQERVGRIIIGLPRSLSGELGEQAGKVKAFADMLGNSVPVPVEMRDERLSTVSARRLMREAGTRKRSGKKRRGERDDAIAAAVILQDYLDEVRRG